MNTRHLRIATTFCCTGSGLIPRLDPAGLFRIYLERIC